MHTIEIEGEIKQEVEGIRKEAVAFQFLTLDIVPPIQMT